MYNDKHKAEHKTLSNTRHVNKFQIPACIPSCKDKNTKARKKSGVFSVKVILHNSAGIGSRLGSSHRLQARLDE